MFFILLEIMFSFFCFLFWIFFIFCNFVKFEIFVCCINDVICLYVREMLDNMMVNFLLMVLFCFCWINYVVNVVMLYWFFWFCVVGGFFLIGKEFGEFIFMVVFVVLCWIFEVLGFFLRVIKFFCNDELRCKLFFILEVLDV